MNLLCVVAVVFGTTVFGLPTSRDTCDCGNIEWNSYIIIFVHKIVNFVERKRRLNFGRVKFQYDSTVV